MIDSFGLPKKEPNTDVVRCEFFEIPHLTISELSSSYICVYPKTKSYDANLMFVDDKIESDQKVY